MSAYLALLAASAAAPMQPSAKWNVNYGESSCMLTRRFGEGDDATIIGWQSLPLDDRVEVYVSQKGAGTDFIQGAIGVRFGSGEIAREVFNSYPIVKEDVRIMRFDIARATLDAVTQDTTMTLSPSRGRNIQVALVGIAPTLAALRACNDDTASEWGIDPSERDRIGIHAIPIARGSWFQPKDYPVSAIAAGRQGFVAMLTTVAPDGRISECRVVKKSGSADFDRVACERVMARGRYVPAMDKAGRPMTAHYVQQIKWMMQGWKSDAAYRLLSEQKARDYDAELNARRAAQP